jgi:hypothetical protein
MHCVASAGFPTEVTLPMTTRSGPTFDRNQNTARATCPGVELCGPEALLKTAIVSISEKGLLEFSYSCPLHEHLTGTKGAFVVRAGESYGLRSFLRLPGLP